jgi:diguanylate cyclase (GGDEF)-like protein
MADGGWVATTDDITERERLAAELASQHGLLQERTALLQAIIDNFPGGIGFYDRDLRVAVCNDKAKSILDLPERFFASGPPRLEDIVRFNAMRGEYGPGDVEEHVRSKLALIAEQGSYHFERSRPDGTVLDVRGVPVKDIGFLTTYMDITERYRAEAKIAHMATHDALTDLPNRVLFQERLAEALGASGQGAVALLMLDLNRFKDVNDIFGHPMGDRLLKAVADRLTRAVRSGDTVARLGGDEFAVVLKTSDAVAEARSIAERIQQALTQPFALDEHTLRIGTSIGIAIALDHADAERLIKEADVALYRAKADGGGCSYFFNDEHDRGNARNHAAPASRNAFAA